MSSLKVDDRPNIRRADVAANVWSEVVVSSSALHGCGSVRVALRYTADNSAGLRLSFSAHTGQTRDDVGDYLVIGSGEHYAWFVDQDRPLRFWVCPDGEIAPEIAALEVMVTDGPCGG